MQNTQLFPIGDTEEGKTSDGSLKHEQHLGQEVMVPDYEILNSNVQSTRVNETLSGRKSCVVLCRNNSGGVIYHGEVRAFDTAVDGAKHLSYVNGLATGDVRAVVVVCHSLNGVADGDLFWGVVEGLAYVNLPATEAAYGANSIVVGDNLEVNNGVIRRGTFAKRRGYALWAKDKATAAAGERLLCNVRLDK